MTGTPARVKRFVKRLIPPLVLDAYSRVRFGTYHGSIWSGVYRHIRDVPVAGEGWAGSAWLSATLALTQTALAEVRRTGTIPAGMPSHHAPLAQLAAVVHRLTGRVRVLDVGGGMGVSYAYLWSGMGQSDLVEYHVVDSAAACEAGRRLFADDDRIRFHEDLPPLSELDIVYLGAMIQYVEDYESFLERVAAYRPAYLLLTFVPAGDIPTFASQQRNMKASRVACWFLNAGELISVVERQGYALIYRGIMDRPFDMSNFPEQYRLTKMPHFLFART